MKNIVQKIKWGFLFLAFSAVTVENPAPGFFSEHFGTDFRTIIGNVLQLILGFAGLIAVAFVIIGGYQIATSRGSAEAAGEGKKTLTNAIIGLVVILLSYLIVRIVINAAFGNV